MSKSFAFHDYSMLVASGQVNSTYCRICGEIMDEPNPLYLCLDCRGPYSGFEMAGAVNAFHVPAGDVFVEWREVSAVSIVILDCAPVLDLGYVNDDPIGVQYIVEGITGMKIASLPIDSSFSRLVELAGNRIVKHGVPYTFDLISSRILNYAASPRYRRIGSPKTRLEEKT